MPLKRTTFLLMCLPFLAGPACAFTLKKIPESSAFAKPTLHAPQNTMNLMAEEESIEKKSASKAIIYSILLPGLGQYYLGEKRAATMFFISEAAIWTSFVVLRVQGHLRKEGYKEFAAAYAGIKSEDHSDGFFKILVDFDSSYDYEIFLKEEGRIYSYPNSDYEVLQEYYLQNRVSDFEEWSWRSTEDREKYYRIRWGSRLAYRRAVYALALGLGNRVVSAIFAIRSARSINSASGAKNHLSMKIYPDDHFGGMGLGITFARSF